MTRAQRVIGITGSNGKTSTKDFVASILGQAGPVNKTAGNFNNHIGLPLTILKGSESDQFGVWEMGMNHAGEIAPLAAIAQADAAVITHIGTAHIEHLKTRDAIAHEKTELARAIEPGGYVILPQADDYFDYVQAESRATVLGAGWGEGVIQGSDLELHADGSRFTVKSEFADSFVVDLPVPGKHMASNALLAIGIGLKEGLSPDQITSALAGCRLTGGRLEAKQIAGFSILDDSYNANPDSMKAALDVLAATPAPGAGGERVAVLGFMGELGEHEEGGHREVGAHAASVGIDRLIVTHDRARPIAEGAEKAGLATTFVESQEAAAAFLHETLAETAADHQILVKGSRAAAMEKVIDHLQDLANS